MAEFPLGDNSMQHLGTDPTPQQPEYNAAEINREIASINMREGKSIGFFVERDLNGDLSIKVGETFQALKCSRRSTC